MLSGGWLQMTICRTESNPGRKQLKSRPDMESVTAFHKWRVLGLLALVEVFVMGLWFSASAVVPQLTIQWGLDSGQQSWMTMSVQIGFVVGALLSAALNLADRIKVTHLIAVSEFARGNLV
jgi:hypothetical protein